MFEGDAVLTGGDALDDVIVVQQTAALGFAIKAIDVRLIAGEVVGQHLDGDVAILGLVIAEIDEAHAAFAERPQDAEPTQAAQ